jgi:hypothetical protein
MTEQATSTEAGPQRPGSFTVTTRQHWQAWQSNTWVPGGAAPDINRFLEGQKVPANEQAAQVYAILALTEAVRELTGELHDAHTGHQ